MPVRSAHRRLDARESPQSSRRSGGERGFNDGRTYGCDFTSLTCDGRVVLVLASEDCVASSMISSPQANGVLVAADGRKIPWSCPTEDGTRGTLTLGEQKFDLTKGAVFLISFKDKLTKVEQVAVDMTKLGGGKLTEKLDAVAAAEPKLQTFLKECRGEK